MEKENVRDKVRGLRVLACTRSTAAMLLWILCIAQHLGTTVAPPAPTTLPVAVWDFDEATRTTIDDTNPYIATGSSLVFHEDCPEYADISCRSLEFSQAVNSYGLMYRVSSLGIDTELSVIMYINTDGVDYTPLGAEDTLMRVLMDFAEAQTCQNGWYFSNSRVPTLKYYEFESNQMKMGMGDYRSCNVENKEYWKATGKGWQKVGFSIKYSPNSKCSIHMLDEDGTGWIYEGIVFCKTFSEVLADPLLLGVPIDRLVDSGLPYAENFVGKVTCIQIYDKALADVSKWHDACGSVPTSHAIPYRGYVAFGVETAAEEFTTLEAASTSSTTTAPPQASNVTTDCQEATIASNNNPQTTTASNDNPQTTVVSQNNQGTVECLETAAPCAVVTTQTTATEAAVTPSVASAPVPATVATKRTVHDGMCPCMCGSEVTSASHNYTQQQVDEMVKDIQEELIVDKQSVSSEIRKKTSAQDDRTSVQFVGSLGIALCTTFVFIVLSADAASVIHAFVTFCKTRHSK